MSNRRMSGRRLLWLIATVLVACIAPAVSSMAGSSARQTATQAALRALGTDRQSGALIVFASPAPLPAGTVIREGGPARPAAGGSPAFSPAPTVLVAQHASYLFYEDLAPYREYQHPGRVALVDTRTGHVSLSRTLQWPPLLGDALPVFLSSLDAYDSSQYRVLDRPYSAASRLTGAPVHRSANVAPAAPSPTVTGLLASEHACALGFSNPVYGRFYAFAGVPRSLDAFQRQVTSLGVPYARYSLDTNLTPSGFITHEIAAHGCRDVLLYLAGGGYATAPAVNIGMRTERHPVLHQDVTAATLSDLIAAHRTVHFELVTDSADASGFQALSHLANVRAVATPRGGPSFDYLPAATVAGKLTANTTDPDHLPALTNRLLAGLQSLLANGCEIARLGQAAQAGTLGSGLAYLVARGLLLGAPDDFVALSGVGSAPTVTVHGVTVGAAGCTTHVAAAPDTYTTASDTGLSVTAGQGVLANDTDSAGAPLSVDALNGATGTPPLVGTSAKGAKVTLNGDGSFTYDPTTATVLQGLGEGQQVTDSFTYGAADGDGGTGAGTVTITVTGVHRAPALAGIEATTLSDDAGTPPVPVTSALTVSAPDAATLTGATVSISSGLVGSEDVLGFADQSGITGTYDASTGVLTLTGSASPAAYQTALRSVTYQDTDGSTPTTGARTISFQVRDGSPVNGRSNTVSRTVDVAPNPAPVAAPDTATTDKHTAVDIAVLANDSDPDGQALHVDPASLGTANTKGQVTVQPDGSIRYDPNGQFDSLQQGQTASDTFTYQASNGFHDSSPATVTVTITGVNDPPVLAGIESGALSERSGDAPVPVTSTLTVSDDDDPTLSSATVAITSGLDSGADQLGFTNQNGITGSYDAATGVLTLTGTGALADYQSALRAVTFSTTDPSSTPAARTVTFTATDTVGATSAAVSRQIDVTKAALPPTANTDTYTAVGNTPLAVGTTASGPAVSQTGSVLSNDVNSDPSASLSVTSNTQPAHGSVTMSPDGSFTYTPATGYSGPDSFTYTETVSDSAKSSTGTVDLTVGPVVWYVDDSRTAAGNGTAASPFTTLGAANTSAQPNSIVFLYQGNGNYTGGATLQSGEQLLGQPDGLTVNGATLVPAGGSAPTITNAGGDGISLAQGADVEGIDVASAAGNGISATNVNAATVGAATPVVISGAGGDGIHVTGGNGDLNFGQTSVSGAGGHSVSVANRTGGTTTFAGAITDRATGISLSANTGSTLDFTGTINAATGTASAFSATGGGTVQATGSGSTLTSTTGTALSVLNTTIGAGGLTFQSISANGAANGIDLNSTGSAGALKVTGTGSAGSGGTIQNSTGANVLLANTSGPSLTDVVIKSGQQGIAATNVSGFAVAGSTVSGNGTQAGQDGLNFSGLTGTASITNSTITGSADQNALIADTTGSLNLTISGSTFSNTTLTAAQSPQVVGDGLQVDATGATNATVDITGSTFSGNYGDEFHFSDGPSGNSGTTAVTFSNNYLSNPLRVSAVGDGASLGFGGAGHHTVTVADNTSQFIKGDAIAVDENGAGTLTGTVDGNTVGTAGSGCSGSLGGSDVTVTAEGTGTETMAVTNNHLYQYNGFDGLDVLDREGSPTQNVTITGNTIADPVGLSASTGQCGVQGGALWGVRMVSGAQSSDGGVMCANVSGNTLAGSAPSQTDGGIDDFEYDQSGSATFKLPGYTGAASDGNAAVAYFANRNTGNGAPSGDTYITSSTTSNIFLPTASCPTP